MRLPPKVQAALEATGKEWTVEQGGSHLKIRVNGAFVGILPKNMREGSVRSQLNLVAQIRRAG